MTDITDPNPQNKVRCTDGTIIFPPADVAAEVASDVATSVWPVPMACELVEFVVLDPKPIWLLSKSNTV